MVWLGTRAPRRVASVRCSRAAPRACSSSSAIRSPRRRPASPDDWYANVFWVQRRKCLLVTHAETLFCVFTPAVRAASPGPLHAFVAALIARQLAAEGFPAGAPGRLDSGQASIAKTADPRCLAA
jgi:hypothetical protein